MTSLLLLLLLGIIFIYVSSPFLGVGSAFLNNFSFSKTKKKKAKKKTFKFFGFIFVLLFLCCCCAKGSRLTLFLLFFSRARNRLFPLSSINMFFFFVSLSFVPPPLPPKTQKNHYYG